jgi:hypothetical protein
MVSDIDQAPARQRLTPNPAESAGSLVNARATGREKSFVFNIAGLWVE